MNPQGFLEAYSAKLLEYSLGVGYLVAFVPFWRYVQGGRGALAAAEARAPAPSLPELLAGWFALPAGVHLHPGHSWALPGPDGLVTVGLDDFAQKLVDPERVVLPPVGASVGQGVPAIHLDAGPRSVSMLSPVDGEVVEVNPRAVPGVALADPYGAGWLFKVRPHRLAANLKQLLSGAAARRWLEEAGEALAARLHPELGRVYQDGGVPVAGLARELAGEKWDELARKFFLT